MVNLAEVAEITLRSLAVSGLATAMAACWSIPASYLLSTPSRASRTLSSIFEALVGIPTVLVGLLLYMMLSSRGPLGFLGLLYTPQAIAVGEAILITPLTISTSYRVIKASRDRFGELALALGASEAQAMRLVLAEAAPGIVASIVMSFSRAVGELGVALMVGGNIRGYTRVITTSIALEVARGEYEMAVSLGMILVSIMLLISFLVRLFRRVGE